MKKLYKIFLLSLLPAFCISACDNSERQKAAKEKINGTVQETMGNLTDDSDKKNEGKANKTKGDLRSTKEDVKDYITGN